MIILDNGHGINTPGKRSPFEPVLYEYEFNRDVVKRISNKLNQLHIKNTILVPEDEDVSLSTRVKRANSIYKQYPDAILISIHANAGCGTGWEAFTSINKTKSDHYATILYNSAKTFFPNWKIRCDFTDGDADKESNFYILKNTRCPAILTENFFMDTRKDYDFIYSDAGRELIADMHVHAIKQFYE